jgi:hypothetical protein
MNNDKIQSYENRENHEVIIGPLRVIGPYNVISTLLELKTTYRMLSETLGIQYDVEFLRETGLPITGNVFKYSEANFKICIARKDSNFYIYIKNYSPKLIIDKLLFLSLLELGFARIHSGGIQVKNGFSGVLLFPGKGGVGKTTIVLNLILTDPRRFYFLGDDIAAINEKGIVYPLPRKLNIYEYHIKLLRIDTLRVRRNFKRYLKKYVLIMTNKLINISRSIFKISYELPYPSSGWIGEFDVSELFKDISLGTPDIVKKVFVLAKSYNGLNMQSLSKNEAISFIINETISEEIWGHVNKFFGLATTLFRFNPSVKMYEILNKAFHNNIEFYIIEIPKIQEQNLNEIIRLISKTIGIGYEQ